MPGRLQILGILLLTFTPSCVRPPSPPPNIVLIISDDHGWMDHGFMGSVVVETPHLDQLATEGFVFTRGYVPTAVCRPSLASMITGLSPHVHGITGNDPPGGRSTMFDPEARAEMEALFRTQKTLPELLAEKGYVSFQSGKWWEGDPLDHGFTAAMTHGNVENGGRHGDEGLRIGREGMQPLFDFIDTTADSPFFIWYAPFLPHTPHNPPDRLLKRFLGEGADPAVAAYHAMITWFDETIGTLVEHLGQSGHLDNTVILYVVDNGWIQPTDGLVMADSRAKMSPYDAGVRTPVIVHWPGHVDSGRDEHTLVSSLDVMPTILQMTGIASPEDLEGISLLDSEARNARTRLSGALFAHTAVAVDRPAANLKYRYCITRDGWKLILPWLPNRDVTLMIDGSVADWMRFEPELYNVVEDPHEEINLASNHPGLVDSLATFIDEWWDP